VPSKYINVGQFFLDFVKELNLWFGVFKLLESKEIPDVDFCKIFRILEPLVLVL